MVQHHLAVGSQASWQPPGRRRAWRWARLSGPAARWRPNAAFGRAGLTGLEGFSEAERQELAIPQAQATLAKTQAETKEATAKAGMTEAEAQYYKQHPEAAGAKFAPELYKVQQIKQANTALAASWMDGQTEAPA